MIIRMYWRRGNPAWLASFVRFWPLRAGKSQFMELISDLSHQLKTPLANIIMNTELLQNPALKEEQRIEFLEHTRSQAGKMQWLMADLLKASRLENGMIHFDAGYTGVEETIARAVSAVFAQASSKKIEIIVEEFEDFRLYHNPKWTAEAMTNLLENAIKYSPPGSRIRIRPVRLDIYTRILIMDEGIGIPKSEFNRIFRRFYRGKEVEQQEGRTQILGNESLPPEEQVYHPGDRVTMEYCTEDSTAREIRDESGKLVDVVCENLAEKEYEVMAIVEIPYSMNIHRYSANSFDTVLPLSELETDHVDAH